MPSSSHNMSFWENQLSKHKQREFWRRLLFAEMRIPQFWPNNEMPFFPTIPSEFTFAESSPIICLYEYKKMNDEIFFIFCYYKCCVSNIQFIFLVDSRCARLFFQFIFILSFIIKDAVLFDIKIPLRSHAERGKRL